MPAPWIFGGRPFAQLEPVADERKSADFEEKHMGRLFGKERQTHKELRSRKTVGYQKYSHLPYEEVG